MNRVIDTRDVACEDDPAAEALARRLFADLPQVHAVEVWVRPRLVNRLSHEPEQVARKAEPGKR